ncbi:MAG: hypothetical protein ACFFB2_12490 [Promethearchaeota archaeon]
MVDNAKRRFSKTEGNLPSEINISKGIFTILSFLAVLASVCGFFISFSIIVVSDVNTIITFPHGFILGILLLFGGITLLIGLLILDQESKKTKRIVSSNTTQSEQNHQL